MYQDLYGEGARFGESVTTGKRDTANHQSYDFDLLKEKRRQEVALGRKQFKHQSAAIYYQAMVVLQAYLLFNAIITLMALAQQYGVKKQLNSTLQMIAVFTPLVFFLLIFILFNNYYSEMVYYHYLEYSAIVDFPDSALPMAWVTNAMPLTFLLVFLAYIVFMFFYYVTTGATVGEVWVFMSNAVIGVFLFWYRHQSIESKFISLSDYIQSFPNNGGDYGNMDFYAMEHACKALEHNVVLESPSMCYSGYMRDWWWGPMHSDLGVVAKALHFGGLLSVVGGAAIAALFMLDNVASIQQHAWESKIMPCVNVCLQYTMGNCTACLGTCRNATDNHRNTVCNGLDAKWMKQCVPWCQ